MSDYDLLATFYDAFIDPKVYEEYVQLVEKYTSVGTMLDIGCGTGSLALEFAKRGYKVMATDLSESMLQLVSYRAKTEDVALEIGIYDMLDPIPSTFETVIASMDVLNHLDDLEDVAFGLTNIFQALDANGIFIFDVLSAEYIDLLDGYMEDDPHYRFHWESHKGEKEHSIVHTITLHFEDDVQEVKIYEQTHDANTYEEIAIKIGFSVLERIELPERTIFVMQRLSE